MPSQNALLLASALLLACLVPAVRTASAGSPESRDSQRAGEIQIQAEQAWRDGRLDDALRLAARAAGLDPGPSTWLAQQIRIEVLEKQGLLRQAREHLGSYMALEGLFAEHRDWGREVGERLDQELERRRVAAAVLEQARLRRRGVGIGLMVGGVVPLGLGLGFLGNYAWQGADPALSGGWRDCAAVLFGAALVMEGIGIALAVSASKRRATRSGGRASRLEEVAPARGRSAPSLAAGLVPARAGGLVLGVAGRF